MPESTVSVMPCYFTHPHTRTPCDRRRRGWGPGYPWWHRGRPVGQCTMGLVVMVIVRTGLQCASGGVVEEGSNDLAVVLRLLESRSPSDWSVGLGFHLNVPLSRWTEKGVGDVGGVLEAPTLGSIGFRFSRVPPPTLSAAHTDLKYLKNHARDEGPPSHCIRGHMRCRLRATVRKRQASSPGPSSASGPSVPGLPRSSDRVLAEPESSSE